MRRFLIVSGILTVALVVIYGGISFRLFYALTRSPDPYPAFMADSQLKDTRSYQQAALTFSEFVAKTFPIGSKMQDAVAQITSEGFRITKSTPDSVEFLWTRSAGPCSEQYLIAINQNVDGAITKTPGNLHPICL
jgi:hypothetical protein